MATPLSNFTINTNKAAASDAKLPTLRGAITVIDIDGTPVEFEHAAWGPNAAKDGKREYFSVRISPKDPALAARQAQMSNGRLATPAIENLPANFDAGKIGSGVVFETTEEERAAAVAAGKKPRSFFGTAIVLLPSGPGALA